MTTATQELLDSLNNTNLIEHSTDILQAVDALKSALHDGNQATLFLPQEWKRHDLEDTLQNPLRQRGRFETSSLPDFSQYVTDHRREDTAIFIAPSGSLVANAVLNLGNATSPGHADDRAQIKPLQTAAYSALVKHIDVSLSQRMAAEFFEDWPEYLQFWTSDGQEIKPGHAIAAIRKINIDAARKTESSVEDLAENRSILESIAVRSADVTPTLIYFKTVPYQGFSERLFALRLSINTNGDQPTLKLQLRQAELHTEAMQREFAALIASHIKEAETGRGIETPTPIYIGDYSRKG